ncbi:MAG: DUF3276 family protein [Bacteroidaceae bacterium]|nr:DUF3276 family protein [Bacteroidaceae bacterium]
MKTEQKNIHEDERDIIFSRTVKAGNRIYYIDVKKNRVGELYLCITESKRQKGGDSEYPSVSYEKHKIFLFPEDFKKFTDNLQEATRYIEEQQGHATPRKEFPSEIQIDIEF